MPDYQAMYLKMFCAAEEAINLLVAAQRECEELYLDDPKPLLTLHAEKALLPTEPHPSSQSEKGLL